MFIGKRRKREGEGCEHPSRTPVGNRTEDKPSARSPTNRARRDIHFLSFSYHLTQQPPFFSPLLFFCYFSFYGVFRVRVPKNLRELLLRLCFEAYLTVGNTLSKSSWRCRNVTNRGLRSKYGVFSAVTDLLSDLLASPLLLQEGSDLSRFLSFN